MASSDDNIGCLAVIILIALFVTCNKSDENTRDIRDLQHDIKEVEQKLQQHHHDNN